MAELVAVGTVLSAVSSISQGLTAGKVAERNAEIARRDAVAARQKAEIDADIQGRSDARTRAAARARRGASGVDPNTGSSLIVEAEDEFLSELNRSNILFGGETTARGFEDEAVVTEAQGKSAVKSGFIGGGTSLLAGFGNLSMAKGKG